MYGWNFLAKEVWRKIDCGTMFSQLIEVLVFKRLLSVASFCPSEELKLLNVRL